MMNLWWDERSKNWYSYLSNPHITKRNHPQIEIITNSHANYWLFQKYEGGCNLSESSKEKVTVSFPAVSTYRKQSAPIGTREPTRNYMKAIGYRENYHTVL